MHGNESYGAYKTLISQFNIEKSKYFPVTRFEKFGTVKQSDGIQDDLWESGGQEKGKLQFALECSRSLRQLSQLFSKQFISRMKPRVAFARHYSSPYTST